MKRTLNIRIHFIFTTTSMLTTTRIDIHNNKYVNPKKYLRATTLHDLGTELDDVLKRDDLDDRDRWMIYNQILRKFLFHLNQLRETKFEFGQTPNVKPETIKKEKGGGGGTTSIHRRLSLPSQPTSTFEPSNSGINEHTLFQNRKSESTHDHPSISPASSDISLDSTDGAVGFTPTENIEKTNEYIGSDGDIEMKDVWNEHLKKKNERARKSRDLLSDDGPIEKRKVTLKRRSGTKDIYLPLPSLAKWQSEQKINNAKEKQKRVQAIYRNIHRKNDSSYEGYEPPKLRDKSVLKVPIKVPKYLTTPLKAGVRRKSSHRTPLLTRPNKIRALMHSLEGEDIEKILKWDTNIFLKK